MKRSDVTTPIINVLQGPTLQRFDSRDFLLTSFVIGQPKVAAHKTILGRQTYCFTTWRRYWVWETDLWRIYVNDDAGVAFEVPIKFTPEQAVAAWSNYKEKMGVTPERIEAMKAKMESMQ